MKELNRAKAEVKRQEGRLKDAERCPGSLAAQGRRRQGQGGAGSQGGSMRPRRGRSRPDATTTRLQGRSSGSIGSDNRLRAPSPERACAEKETGSKGGDAARKVPQQGRRPSLLTTPAGKTLGGVFYCDRRAGKKWAARGRRPAAQSSPTGGGDLKLQRHVAGNFQEACATVARLPVETRSASSVPTSSKRPSAAMPRACLKLPNTPVL